MTLFHLERNSLRVARGVRNSCHPVLLESAPERSTKSGEIGRLGSSHKKYMTDVKERDKPFSDENILFCGQNNFFCV